MAKKLVLSSMLLLFLASCAEGKFVGFERCMPDGSQVWWLFQNAEGTYEGSKSKPENCR